MKIGWTVPSDYLHLTRNIFASLTTSQLSKDKEIQPPQNHFFIIHDLKGTYIAFYGWCLFENDDIIKGENEERKRTEKDGFLKKKEQEEEKIGFS